MSAIGKAKSKLKTGAKTIMESPARGAVQVAMGFAIGVIIDLILEALVWNTEDFVNPEESGWGRLEVGFPFYFNHPTVTSIAYDDLILIFLTVGMFILGWFKKSMLYILGFLIGWYMSSCLGLYSAMVTPFLPEEETP